LFVREIVEGNIVMVQQSLGLAMWYGSLSAIAVSLGKGLQKYGVEVIFKPKEMFRRENLFRLLVWCLGTAGIVARTQRFMTRTFTHVNVQPFWSGSV